MDVDEVLKKYSRQIDEQIKTERKNTVNYSKDYFKFKNDMMPSLTRYEKWARSLGNVIKIKVSAKDEVKIGKQLEVAHLDISAGEVAGLAIMSLIVLLLVGIIASVSMWLVNGAESFPFLFLFLTLMTGIFLFYYFYSMPSRLAAKWRLKASSQMVPAILYIIIYMKHTSNLERAISFVSQHIDNPLALDFKKVLWDVETGKYSSLKDSLDAYLDFWKDYNIEFVESFHLIESSLYEPNEERRVMILERALRVILDGVYEKMLKYTHSIKSPLTNLYMLGIVLPTLGLALLPLASTLLGGVIKASHVFLIFNLLIPFFVFYLTLQIMLMRPGGYGETSLLEKNPYYSQYQSKKPYLIAGLISFPFLFIGLLPLIFGFTPIPGWLGIGNDFLLSDVGLGFFGKGNFFDFKNINGITVGPFGVGALLLSLFVPLSFILFFSIAYSRKTKQLIKARNSTRDLEEEFNSSLFTLGNRLGDGTPAEIAFAKVADSMKGQKTENFFRIVSTNIQTMGMGLEDAIFNTRRGALVYYPSNLIATSMRILIESVKKGLKVAAESLMSISEYVRNIQKINERLRDLLADVISDMRSNMTFLAPLLAGIVIGLTAMITGILGQLTKLVEIGQGEQTIASFGTISNITNLFDITKMVSPYFMQIAIGLYIIEIIFILTGTLITIDSGEDKLRRTHDIGKNLMSGGILYLITALISIIALAALAAIALKGF